MASSDPSLLLKTSSAATNNHPNNPSTPPNLRVSGVTESSNKFWVPGTWAPGMELSSPRPIPQTSPAPIRGQKQERRFL